MPCSKTCSIKAIPPLIRSAAFSEYPSCFKVVVPIFFKAFYNISVTLASPIPLDIVKRISFLKAKLLSCAR
jgi:hypothetical protein